MYYSMVKFYFFDGRSHKNCYIPFNDIVNTYLVKQLQNTIQYPILISAILTDGPIPYDKVDILFTSPLSGIAAYAHGLECSVTSNWTFHKCFDIKYVTWLDLPDIGVRLKNTKNNFNDAIIDLIKINNNPFQKKLEQSVKCVIDTQNTFFSSSSFFRPNVSLSIYGPIHLDGSPNWAPIQNSPNIWYNYVIFPCANHYKVINDIYYLHYANAVKLMIQSVLLINTTKEKVFVVNAVGLGAFLRKKDEMTQYIIKKEALKILLNEFSKVPIYLVMVLDNEMCLMFEEIKKDIVINGECRSADMLDLAFRYAEQDYEVFVAMAADTFGPGNRFINFPTSNQGGNASSASDENNTRRSGIIDIVLYIMLKEYFDLFGKEKVLSDVNKYYDFKRKRVMTDVIPEECITYF